MKNSTENGIQPSRKTPEAQSDRVRRFSVSLPESLFRQLDEMVEERGFDSRSQAIGEMIREQLIEHRSSVGSQVMAGTITLVYDHQKKDLQHKLREIQYRYIKEIISSQHVHLENHHSMEVLLVQGPADQLKRINNELATCKGVRHSRLTITSTLLPPLY